MTMMQFYISSPSADLTTIIIHHFHFLSTVTHLHPTPAPKVVFVIFFPEDFTRLGQTRTLIFLTSVEFFPFMMRLKGQNRLIYISRT